MSIQASLGANTDYVGPQEGKVLTARSSCTEDAAGLTRAK